MARAIALACALACAHLALGCDDEHAPAETIPEPAAPVSVDEPAATEVIGVGLGPGPYRVSHDAPLEPVDPRSRVQAGEIAVTGPLEEIVVRRLLRRYTTDLRACHTAAIAEDGDVQGELTLRLSVETTGTIRSARATQSTLPSGLAACIEQRARDWELAAPGTDTADVRATFTFSVEPAREDR